MNGKMDKGRDNKPHIGIFGRRNIGKSSLINALAGQDIAIVSDVAGTTTDPVKKSIEIFGVGPVILFDTAGIDDFGNLGEKRIAKTKTILKIIDLAILVISGNIFDDFEKGLIADFNAYGIPFFILHNKNDIETLGAGLNAAISKKYHTTVIGFSALAPENSEEVIGAIRRHIPETAYQSNSLVGDIINYGDVVLLVTPIDTEAPEGRMILPQMQAIRDILDNNCIAVVLKESELDGFITKMNPKPALVITDSQAFAKVNASVPENIPLTSFSIMLARYKGDYINYLKGTPYLSKLADGDRVLILESCTHQVSCDDIGRIKIPGWLTKFSGKKLEFVVVAGLDELPQPIHDFKMVIQCGGCMITRKQIANRLKPAIDEGIPVTNYGMAIAWMHGIFERAIMPFMKVTNL